MMTEFKVSEASDLRAEVEQLREMCDRYRYEHKMYLDEIDGLLKDLKHIRREMESANVLVYRAERAISIIAEWYCKDVTCERCRLRDSCIKSRLIEDAAYTEAMRDDTE